MDFLLLATYAVGYRRAFLGHRRLLDATAEVRAVDERDQERIRHRARRGRPLLLAAHRARAWSARLATAMSS